MPTFDEVPEEHVPTHLLLCSDTKGGKSDYAASAAKDGFHMIYVDSDNGANTLKEVLKDDPEAKKRIIYIKTQKPYFFMQAFCSMPSMRWNLTRDELFGGKNGVPDDDIILELKRPKIPPGFIFTLDTWSTVAYQAMDKGAADAKLDLNDPLVEKRKAYQAAGYGLTSIAKTLQLAQFHEIIQAHGARYEIKEKTPGGVREQSKEAEMVIKEILTIPVSSSNPHAIITARHFNEIGWLSTNRMGNQILSFKKMHDRIGGGTKNGEGDPRKEYSFRNLFGEPISYTDEEIGVFYREFRASEYVPPQSIRPTAPKPTAAPAAATGTLPPAGEIAPQGVKPAGLTSMFKR